MKGDFLMTKFYAVQHGSDYSSDYGSANKRKAYAMARELGREYPQDEIRISVCSIDDDFCTHEIIIRDGNN